MDKEVCLREKALLGEIEIPSDKSISHRAAMIGALTFSKVEISNFSKGKDCHSTLNVLKNLGCDIKFLTETSLVIDNSEGFKNPSVSLDCGNSGTTMRLMAGILSSRKFTSTLIGDASLMKRPMKRIIEPLSLMGATITSSENKAPLFIEGHDLKPINYHSELASAQVKSAVILAGLNTKGETTYSEKFISRDHTEKMLKYLGADIKTEGTTVKVNYSELEPKPIEVCGDISSAAFFMVAACLVKNSNIVVKNVGVNPTRSGIIDVLKSMNADIELFNERIVCNEPVADIRVKYSENLKAITIEKDIIPRLIDEIPVIAVLATQAEGTTIIKDAADLKNKECDRINLITTQLKKIGADIQQTEDGFIINGKTKLLGDATIQTAHDHRIAMSLYVAGMICSKPILIEEFNWVDISFPEFESLMNKL